MKLVPALGLPIEIRLPLSEMALEIDRSPVPLETNIALPAKPSPPVPRAVLLATASVPPNNVVPPPKLLLPDTVMVPPPLLESASRVFAPAMVGSRLKSDETVTLTAELNPRVDVIVTPEAIDALALLMLTARPELLKSIVPVPVMLPPLSV